MKSYRKSNWRVEVYPKTTTCMGLVNVDEKGACEDILRDVIRHVDGVASAYVTSDVEEVCEHCGAAWTECGDYCNGGCCDKDLG